MGTPFRYAFDVRFGDVDVAGIVYYPRFFHYCHVAFEELFGGSAAYAKVIGDRGIGFPAVHAEIDFKGTLRYGDGVEIFVSSERLGRTSVGLRYELHRANDPRVAALARITTAVVSMETFRPTPLPDDLRAFFARIAHEPTPGNP